MSSLLLAGFTNNNLDSKAENYNTKFPTLMNKINENSITVDSPSIKNASLESVNIKSLKLNTVILPPIVIGPFYKIKTKNFPIIQEYDRDLEFIKTDCLMLVSDTIKSEFQNIIEKKSDLIKKYENDCNMKTISINVDSLNSAKSNQNIKAIQNIELDAALNNIKNEDNNGKNINFLIRKKNNESYSELSKDISNLYENRLYKIKEIENSVNDISEDKKELNGINNSNLDGENSKGNFFDRENEINYSRKNSNEKNKSYDNLVQADNKEEIIKLENVQKTYLLGYEGVAALRGINLSIHSGEFVCIFGNSGGGKTTLLNIIGTIDKPTKGYVYICGIRIDSQTEDNVLANIRLHKMSFVFQSLNLFPSLTALENVQLPMQMKSELTREQIKKKQRIF